MRLRVRVLRALGRQHAELRELWKLAEAYGYADWLVLDTSVVRGLAYYTGIVFEGFDRKGELRAICGGGRYDTLLQTMAGGREDRSQPMVGFGFGDAVIMELLSDKGLLPEAASTADDVIAVMDAELRPQALGVAARLRAKGRRVDVVLDKRKFKWIIRQAERVGAQRLLLVGQTEWDEGKVRVKNLAEREEDDVRREDEGGQRGERRGIEARTERREDRAEEEIKEEAQDHLRRLRGRRADARRGAAELRLRDAARREREHDDQEQRADFRRERRLAGRYARAGARREVRRARQTLLHERQSHVRVRDVRMSRTRIGGGVARARDGIRGETSTSRRSSARRRARKRTEKG